MVNFSSISGYAMVETPGLTAPRVLFYSHDSYGLGHIRRTLSIAREINRQMPDAAMLALTGSLAAHAYDLPSNFDYVKLPAVTKDDDGAYASHRLPIPFADSWSLRERLISETAHAFEPDLIVVDHTPAGLRGEIMRALAEIRRTSPRTKIVLGLRDIIDEPEVVRAQWAREGVYELMDRLYDRILIYGSRRVFDPILEYGFPLRVAAKTSLVGYLRRLDRVTPAAQIRAKLGATGKRLVLVTAGGGQDGEHVISAALDALREIDRSDLATCIVTGPLLSDTARDALRLRAAEVPDLHFITFTDDLFSYVAAADLVISMGGYNSMAEIAQLGKRGIIIPRVFPRKEQLIRAQRFAELGVASFIEPELLSGPVLAAEINRSLASRPPSPVLDFSGLARTGDALAQMVEDAQVQPLIGMVRHD